MLRFFLLLLFSEFYIVTQMHAELSDIDQENYRIPVKHWIVSIVVDLHYYTISSMGLRFNFYSNTYAIVPIAKFISLRHLELSLEASSFCVHKFYPLCFNSASNFMYLHCALNEVQDWLLCRQACWVFVLFVCAAICRDNQ